LTQGGIYYFLHCCALFLGLGLSFGVFLGRLYRSLQTLRILSILHLYNSYDAYRDSHDEFDDENPFQQLNSRETGLPVRLPIDHADRNFIDDFSYLIVLRAVHKTVPLCKISHSRLHSGAVRLASNPHRLCLSSFMLP